MFPSSAIATPCAAILTSAFNMSVPIVDARAVGAGYLRAELASGANFGTFVLSSTTPLVDTTPYNGCTAASVDAAGFVTIPEIAYGSLTFTAWLRLAAPTVLTLDVYGRADIADLQEYRVYPQAADSTISTAFEEHYLYVAKSLSNRRGELLVFFPGTAASPHSFTVFAQEAARQGFHVIVLRYPNAEAIAVLCAQSLDSECHSKARAEILNGIDTSSLLHIAPADAIRTRLTKLLKYLDARDPANNWGQFLLADAVRWDKIRVAGHSQGGGHAAYVAKSEIVARVCLFSAPADWDATGNQPAAWLRDTHQTPSVRYAGFSHLKDPVVTWTVATAAWTALGMISSTPPTVESLTNLDGYSVLGSDSTGTGYHGMTITDPVYAAVWRQICLR